MCGRYVLYGPKSRLLEYFALRECPDFAPRYNVAPQSDVLIVRQRPDGTRAGTSARWGLIPHWAKDAAIGRMLGNARAESLAEKAAFRSAYKRFRCLIPANGFYEWKAVASAGRTVKQPYFIHPADDDQLFGLAGLVERWIDPASAQEVLSTCVITTAANALMAPIHDRMPVIVDPDDFDAWLSPDNQDTDTLAPLLAPAPAKGMRATRVGTAVNRTANDGPELLTPVDD